MPDLLTERDFLVREFPMPANPQRPLAVVTPDPGDDEQVVVRHVEETARRGYGGIMLDPTAFGAQFLGKAWFDLVGLFVEACRLTGLYLWLLDGFTAGEAIAPIMDAHYPNWRGREIIARTLPPPGAERFDLLLQGPEDGRLLGLLARAADRAVPPINLCTCFSDGRLVWDPPPGQWEVISFWTRANAAAGALDWHNGDAVAAWLQAGFEPYRDLFSGHLGRTIQGFLVQCPAWPRPKPIDQESAWSFAADLEPSWLELAGLVCPTVVAKDGRPYAARLAENLRRSYLAPLREWCWRNRLRVGGYRLGGLPLPWLTVDLDLGGQPDLTPGAKPDLDELACMAGASRRHRQEKVACRLDLTGEIASDRATVGRLAAAGADFMFIGRPVDYPPDCELALTDYAARVVMAVAAGCPAAELELTYSGDPSTMTEIGRQVRRLARQGFEAQCAPAAATGTNADNPAFPQSNDGVDQVPAAATAEIDAGLNIPAPLSLRVRKVEEWTVCTVFNLGAERWRGPIDLPANGAAEIWQPTTGEIRAVTPLAIVPGLRVPLALEPGEAAVAVVKKPGPPRQLTPNRLVEARLNLERNWVFNAPDGNPLPLTWHEYAPGNYAADFIVLSVPAGLRLEGKPPGGMVWLNGEMCAEDEPSLSLAAQVQVGGNRLEMRGVRHPPKACLRGEFICRGDAIARVEGPTAGPWNLNGYPYYTGPGVYRQTVTVPADLARADLTAWLEITALAEAALVRLNGELAGALPWPPYRLNLGPATCLQAGDNLLELEIHAPAGKDRWAFKGLLGEVFLFFVEQKRKPAQSALDIGDFWPF